MAKHLLALIFVITPLVNLAKGDLLDREVTIAITNTPVKTILEKIEVLTQVQFSYSPEIIDEDRLVSLNLKNETIGYGLSLIFDETIRFKEVGNHIVILKNEEKKKIRERKKKDLVHTFSGQITDQETGEYIKGASIYDVEAKFAAITDDRGYYSLTVPHASNVRSLYFKKKGYHEHVIVIDLSSDTASTINVELVKELDEMAKIDPIEIGRVPQTFEEKAISGILISDETYIHGENLEEIKEERIFQISLVPSVSIGSNLSTNALITNNFSLNIISGFSSGVNGVEIGGVLNIVKGDCKYLQAAGISNIVGGEVKGLQVGGISNMVTGNFYGAQFAGILNANKQNITGFQGAGITNLNRGGFNGIQASGIYNLAAGNSIGLQVSGIANQATKDLYGGQISGIANMAKDGRNWVQLAGITNYSRINYGVQISGILNVTDHNNILQVGLINISKKSRGVSLGLINFVKEGYHSIEVSSNSFSQANLKIKSGTQRLYNTYGFGVRLGSTNMYAPSLGLGTYFNLMDKLRISVDADYSLVFDEAFIWNQTSKMVSISPSLDFRLNNHMILFGGPQFNIHYLQHQKSDGSYWGDRSFLDLSSTVTPTYKLNYWLGFQAGIRFF